MLQIKAKHQLYKGPSGNTSSSFRFPFGETSLDPPPPSGFPQVKPQVSKYPLPLPFSSSYSSGLNSKQRYIFKSKAVRNRTTPPPQGVLAPTLIGMYGLWTELEKAAILTIQDGVKFLEVV